MERRGSVPGIYTPIVERTMRPSSIALADALQSDHQPNPEAIRLTSQFVTRDGGELARVNPKTVNRRVYPRHWTTPLIDRKLRDRTFMSPDLQGY